MQPLSFDKVPRSQSKWMYDKTMGYRKEEAPGLASLLMQQHESLNFFHSAEKAAADELLRACQHVFDLDEKESSSIQPGDQLLQDVVSLIDQRVADSVAADIDEDDESGNSSSGTLIEGRIGPSTVGMDKASASGNISYSTSGLTIESLANFSSCRSTVAVYSGKWQYEATVGTAGIQQIGWCTIHCPFTQEEGVGDAPDSYAFDGKRICKWSVKNSRYGQSWSTGDVIGTCIDLDNATITFYRNGVSMGTAYTNVRIMQPHLAYFPAVSLSYAERCELNFGARPLEYPVAGYQPLHAAPSMGQQSMGGWLTNCLERLARSVSNRAASSNTSPEEQGPRFSLPWEDVVMLAGAIMEHLAPFLVRSYCILHNIRRLVGTSVK